MTNDRDNRMNLITRFKQTCAKLNPDLDLALNECDDDAFLDPITEAHWQGYQMRDSEFKKSAEYIKSISKKIDPDEALYQDLTNPQCNAYIIPPLTTKGGE